MSSRNVKAAHAELHSVMTAATAADLEAVKKELTYKLDMINMTLVEIKASLTKRALDEAKAKDAGKNKPKYSGSHTMVQAIYPNPEDPAYGKLMAVLEQQGVGGLSIMDRVNQVKDGWTFPKSKPCDVPKEVAKKIWQEYCRVDEDIKRQLNTLRVELNKEEAEPAAKAESIPRPNRGGKIPPQVTPYDEEEGSGEE